MSLEKSIEEVVRSLIYQGRHFDPATDEEVVGRSVRFIKALIEVGGKEVVKRRKWAYGDKYTGRK